MFFCFFFFFHLIIKNNRLVLSKKIMRHKTDKVLPHALRNFGNYTSNTEEVNGFCYMLYIL